MSMDKMGRLMSSKRKQFLNNSLRAPFFLVGDQEYTNKRLDLGALKGNRFTVCIRHMQTDGELMSSSSSDEVFAKANQSLEGFKSDGFINYYGLQRFGNDADVATHTIGILVLQKKYQEVIDLMLGPKREYKPDIAQARLRYKNKTISNKEYLQMLPRAYTIERQLLMGLDSKKNPQAVFETLMKNVRTMYIHAVQSYLWNIAASARVDQYGHVPIVGDLVLQKGTKKKEVVVLTEDNIKGYSMSDIQLPVPGVSSQYPTHNINKAFYLAEMAKMGLEERHWKEMQNAKREYSLRGDYRQIVARPNDVSWQWVLHEDPDEELIDPLNMPLEYSHNGQKLQGKKHCSLLLRFSLATSTYATICMREFLRISTNASDMFKLQQEALKAQA